MFDQITSFLLGYGWLGVVAGCLAWVSWKVWGLFEESVTSNRNLVTTLVEENRKDREKHALREESHDAHRDEWLSEFSKVISEKTANQVQTVGALEKVKDELKEIHLLIHQFAHGK